MRIVFMGTPDFAVKSLERLYNDGHEIAGVFTGADKPKNRGLKPGISPVKELALLKGTPVYQPNTLNDAESADNIRKLNCDLIVVVAYGKKLPNEILDIPPLGCINIHGSILPKYRGASPIQHAVLNGETETGVTSMYIAEEMDAGDILFIKQTKIGDDETSLDLFERLGNLGADLLSETISAINTGTAKRLKQNINEVTYAPLLTKDMSPIDWNKPAKAIKAQVRGLIPWPVASMQLDGCLLKIFSVDIKESKQDKPPGSIISLGKQGIEVACSDGTVIIKEVQAAGGKKMPASDYLRGHKKISSKGNV